MLHLKRFDNFNYLYICLPKTANINDIVDDTVLGYVHKAIQSYETVVMSDFDSTIYECQYLDLYCNGLKNCQDNTGSNGLTSRLHIPFLEYEPSSKANGEYHTHNIITFVKNKDMKDSSAVGAMDGEIHCSIGAKPYLLGGTAKARSLLRCEKDLMTEISIDLKPDNRKEGEDREIGY